MSTAVIVEYVGDGVRVTWRNADGSEWTMDRLMDEVVVTPKSVSVKRSPYRT